MSFTAHDPELEDADILKIKRMIPHRYPFLLIDRVINIIPGEAAIGIKNVTVNEPFFEGHFPAQPVMPGVLLVEAMAQTASVLVIRTLEMIDNELLVYFMSLEKTKFRKVVGPADQVELHVKVLRGRGRVWKFWAEARVEGQIAAEAEFTAMIQDPPSAEEA